MGKAFNLGHIFGIQVRLHYTWFIIFTLVTLFLIYPDWSEWLSWVMGITASLLFFASVLAHELAHSLVGRVNGIQIKGITLFIFGGMAHMTKEVTKAGAELKMAAAGPACSLAISGLFGLVWFLTRDIVQPVAVIAGWLALVNVILAAFNLIPGFPLDGGRVFRSILWRTTGNYRRSTRIATWAGRSVAYLFILSGILIVFLHPFGLSWFDGVWLAFIGWFLDNAASASYRQEQWRSALQGLTAADVMTADYTAIPSSTTVGELVQRHVFPRGYQFFPVVDEGLLRGAVTLNNLKSVPQKEWGMTPVREVMTPAERLRVSHPAQDAMSIMGQMAESNIKQIPVVSEGKVVGVVERDSLIKFLRTRSELGVQD
jgi:Zn-dependent protease/predicted transcriptional regulator